MKRLVLLRHAKSSWTEPGLTDHQRPLSPRGVRAAPEMARWIARHGYVPQYALCSDAVRTRQTWELVADVWYGTFGPPPVSMEPDLYLASPYGIRALIGRTGEDIESLLVLGHNPGMHDLASTFVARDGSELHRLLDRKFPTAAAAVLEFDVSDWSDLQPGTARLEAFMRPKDLPRAAELRL